MMKIDEEKSIDKIQHLFMIQMSKKLATEGHFLDVIECIYEKPVDVITFVVKD